MDKNILNLSQYSVLQLDEDEHDYHIYTEVIKPPHQCPYCFASNPVGFGRREQLIKDLPMHGKRVGIYVNTRRMKCKSCTKTFSEVLPEVDDKRAMTKRLERWIGEQSIRRTFISIAEEIGIDESTVRNVFRDYINDLEKTVRFETPRWMGIDEIILLINHDVLFQI